MAFRLEKLLDDVVLHHRPKPDPPARTQQRAERRLGHALISRIVEEYKEGASTPLLAVRTTSEKAHCCDFSQAWRTHKASASDLVFVGRLDPTVAKDFVDNILKRLTGIDIDRSRWLFIFTVERQHKSEFFRLLTEIVIGPLL